MLLAGASLHHCRFADTGALAPRAPAAPAPAVAPPQNTTLWVGRIAPSVEPAFMQQLLEACGPLREWKPVVEPDSGRSKGFGFVTYAEPDGVLVALAVLNSLRLDGQELTLKANKARAGLGGWWWCRDGAGCWRWRCAKGEGCCSCSCCCCR